MKLNKKRPGASRELRGAKAEKSWCKSFVGRTSGTVNKLSLASVVQFRTILVEGIALAGWPKCPWLSRLVDRLTVLTDALAEKSGVRA